MGFLKFLKREKKSDVNELDLPPEPPQLEGFEDAHDFPEFPEIKASDYLDMYKSGFNDEGKTDNPDYEPKMPEVKDIDMPDFPKFKEIGEMPEIPTEPEMSHQTLATPASPEQTAHAVLNKETPEREYQHMQKSRLFHHERKAWEKPARRDVYVRVDKFKAALDDISMIRASVRKSDEALMRLESIKNSKDRSFDKVKLSLEDLQKKLIFIDKTLFEGD